MIAAAAAAVVALDGRIHIYLAAVAAALVSNRTLISLPPSYNNDVYTAHLSEACQAHLQALHRTERK